MELSIWDYIVFLVVLLISAFIGIYYRFTGGKQKTIQEYLLANGQMSAIPVAFSLMASFMSAITLLGISSENYLHGTHFQLINLSYVIATPIITWIYLPVFYKLGNTSVYEYLDLRFGRVARICGSLAFSIQMLLYTGIVLYAPSLALSAATGLNTTLSILTIGFVCTFYSTIGGMKAVLITDVFQSLLMFGAVYIVIIKGILDSDGISNILREASSSGRIEFSNFSLDPTIRHTVWSQVIGGSFIYLSIYAVNQAQVQRLLTVRTLREARASLWISLPILILLSFSTALAGLTIYAKYATCDPIMQGRICEADQILPLFVADTLGEYPGVTGLFVAGLLSGSLSTVSSSINSLAAVTWEDYISPCLKETPSPLISTLTNKFLACAYGVASVGLAFVASQLDGVLQASLTIFGVVGGPLLGFFTVGMLCPFVSQKSIVPSFLCALAFGFWMGFGGPKPPIQRFPGDISGCQYIPEEELACPAHAVDMNMTNGTSTPDSAETQDYFYLYRISYMYYTLIGFGITVLGSCILSLWFPQSVKVSPKLLSPVIHSFVGYCETEKGDRKRQSISSQSIEKYAVGGSKDSGFLEIQEIRAPSPELYEEYIVEVSLNADEGSISSINTQTAL